MSVSLHGTMHLLGLSGGTVVGLSWVCVARACVLSWVEILIHTSRTTISAMIPVVTSGQPFQHLSFGKSTVCCWLSSRSSRANTVSHPLVGDALDLHGCLPELAFAFAACPNLSHTGRMPPMAAPFVTAKVVAHGVAKEVEEPKSLPWRPTRPDAQIR